MQTLDIIQSHPYADIFPMMSDEEYAALEIDIMANGLREPIWLYEGKILDGRNRYKAILELGLAMSAPRIFEDCFLGSDPLAFVVSLNLKRRHLTSSQKAFIALDLLPHLEAQAKERQWAGVDLTEIIPEGNKGEARDKAADMVGTNAHYVTDAKRILEKKPELVEEIKAGRMTIPEDQCYTDQDLVDAINKLKKQSLTAPSP